MSSKSTMIPALTFLGGYHEYFGESVDIEAMVYLMLVKHPYHRALFLLTLP